MPIERKDRSFDRIFDEVEVHNVPAKYIKSVMIILSDNSTIEVNDFDDARAIIESMTPSEVLDVNVSLDYDSIKADVTGEIKNVLDSYFKDEEE